MQFLIEQLWNQAGSRLLLAGAMHEFYTFTLVLVRVSGLMIIGPLFGQALVPRTFRILLIVAVSLVVTPSIGPLRHKGFDRLDVSGNGRLEREELPDGLTPRFDFLAAQQGLGPQQGEDSPSLDRAAWTAPAHRIPASVYGYVRIAASELLLGLVLGLGILILMSGLQAAGELMDQQTGISLGELASPGLEISGSITGTFLFLAGTAILVLLQPFGGHLLILRALLETWQTLPPGEAVLGTSAISLLSQLVQASLVLGIQVAAPLLATMALVALAMGFLGHTVQQFDLFSIGFPVRSLVSMLVMSLVISGAGGLLTEALPRTIDSLADAIAIPRAAETPLLQPAPAASRE